MEILLAGHLGRTFVAPIVRGLAGRGAFRFSAVGLQDSFGPIQADFRNLFEQTWSVGPHAPPRERLPALASEALRAPADLLRRVFRGAADRAIETSLPVAVREALRLEWRCAPRQRLLRSILPRYDVCHVHYASPETLMLVDVLPQTTRLLVSIWGSDLLRCTGELAYRIQRRGFLRADAISLSSHALAELLCAKFGRNLRSKLHILPFGLDGILSAMARLDAATARQAFRQRHGLKEGDAAVCIGTAASSLYQHEAIIDALAELPGELQSRIVAILPWTYKRREGPEYRQAVERKLAATGLRAVFLDRMMREDEVAELRFATDLLLMLPDSDAQSAAMCEVLFAGRPVIVGAWLPYGRLRRRGVHFREMDDWRQLPALIQSILAYHQRELEACRGNRAVIESHFSIAAVIDGWAELYRGLGRPRPRSS